MKALGLTAALLAAAVSARAGSQKSSPAPNRPGVIVSGPVITPGFSVPGKTFSLDAFSLPTITVTGVHQTPETRGTNVVVSPAAILENKTFTAVKFQQHGVSQAHEAAPTATPLEAIEQADAPLLETLQNPHASAETLSTQANVVFEGGEKKDELSPVKAVATGQNAGASLKRRSRSLKAGLAAAALTLLTASPALAQTADAAATAQPAALGVGLAAGLLGLVLGMRHALDPDHVIALLNLVTGAKNKWSGWRLGALWGLGHSLALLVAGGALVLAKTALPPALGAGLESIVALMLIGLGVNAVARERKTAAHGHYHDLEKLKMRPFLIGLIHGLAGSGAVALLALAAVPGVAAGFLYLGMFGLGTIAGMSVVTLFIQALAVRLIGDPKIRGRVAVVAGVLSAAFGAYMLVELLPILLG